MSTPHRVILETRAKIYHTDHKTSVPGWEIVKEGNFCAKCFKEAEFVDPSATAAVTYELDGPLTVTVGEALR